MTDRVLPAIALMIGFCITAPMLDVATKLAATTIPVGQITTARFLVQTVLMIPICLLLGKNLAIPRDTWLLLISRAVFLVIATTCFIAAIRVMPIADALAIAFIEPFIILFLGYFFFEELIGPRRIGASIVGFIGALFVIQPSFAAFGAVALYPLGTAVTFAIYMLLTRRMSRKMHALPMQLYTAAVAVVICLPIMFIADGTGWADLDPVFPDGINWFYLFCVGFFAAISHLMMTYALGMAPTSTLAPLHYFEIVSAVALGYLFFSDFPNATTWIGIAIIVSSGLYVIHRERLTSRQPTPPAPR